MSFWKKILVGMVVVATGQVSLAETVTQNVYMYKDTSGASQTAGYVHFTNAVYSDMHEALYDGVTITGTLSSNLNGGLKPLIPGEDEVTAGSELKINWSVKFDEGTGKYTYTYEVWNPNGPKAGSLSHLTLEVSQGFSANEYTLIEANGGLPTIGAGAEPSVGFSATQWLKIEPASDWSSEVNPYTFTIETIRAPMWGDVLLKDGVWNYVNDGYMGLRSEDITKWLLTPNSGPLDPNDVGVVVPTPAAALLAFPLFAMLGISRPRRQVH